ncbi:MAG: hypothetical protein OQK55_09875, partial [Thermoanaerobaculales bacterium]|nr:hypothetical protein [Thermoanaerobaculales bacterium]
ISSFPVGASEPNGIATDGTLIYTGHFSTQEVIAYDFSGVEQFRWSATLSGLQGMDLVGGELAVALGANIDFFNPATGALNRSIPSSGGGVEGVAFDGAVLWLLDDSIVGINPADGSAVSTIPNAAIGCQYGGTGIAASGPGELALGCEDGSWFLVSSADGSVISSGNNGLNMYGLKAAAPAFAGVAVPTLGAFGFVLFGALIALAGLAVLTRFRTA